MPVSVENSRRQNQPLGKHIQNIWRMSAQAKNTGVGIIAARTRGNLCMPASACRELISRSARPDAHGSGRPRR